MADAPNLCKTCRGRRVRSRLHAVLLFCGAVAFLAACKPAAVQREFDLKFYGFRQSKSFEKQHVSVCLTDSLLFANGDQRWKTELFFAERPQLLQRLVTNLGIPANSSSIRLVLWYDHAPLQADVEPDSWRCTLRLKGKEYLFTGSTATIRTQITDRQGRMHWEALIRSYGHDRLRISLAD
jgi:hypothetical protein